ncbi:MAG TPA: tRNA pseudouridine(38-40) synthase TruA [Acidimicrobiales bacterium]|nr:tRNA pseudouridine(38-40) synthase TruA [Acidimicrobiales bacterium]
MTLFDEELEPAGPEVVPPIRVRMTVAYDGAAFHGFAAQPEVPTVAGKLTLAIGRALRLDTVDLVCAGRTDTGVHARGQVVSFDVPAGTSLDCDELMRRVNRQTAPSVVVRDCAIAEGFDARHDAVARRYRYTVVNAPVPDPLLATQAWWVPEPLDVRAMQAACDPLLGEHDFAAFCRKPTGRRDGTVPGTTRRVVDAEWEFPNDDGVMYFWIEANAFCHQMVRSIVGLLVDVGKGKRHVSDVLAVLRGGDRQANAEPAPPHGLVLWEVTY